MKTDMILTWKILPPCGGSIGKLQQTENMHLRGVGPLIF